MVTTQTKARPKPGRRQRVAPKITVFHCFNAINDTALQESKEAEFHVVKMPCSSLIREVHLLRAFEDGADAVIVLACLEGKCRYVEGNLRAAKRVARVKRLLDDIGIGSGRLDLHNVPAQDAAAVERVIEETLAELAVLEPNPAA